MTGFIHITGIWNCKFFQGQGISKCVGKIVSLNKKYQGIGFTGNEYHKLHIFSCLLCFLSVKTTQGPSKFAKQFCFHFNHPLYAIESFHLVDTMDLGFAQT